MESDEKTKAAAYRNQFKIAPGSKEEHENESWLQEAMKKKYVDIPGEDTEVSFRIGTKELKNEGRVSLSLVFANVGDMLKFRDHSLLDKEMNIRQINGQDSLDGKIPTGRKFILRGEVEESVRVARYITTEV